MALVCCVSLKQRLFWKSKMACIWILESAMVKEETPVILTFLNHCFSTIPKQ